MNTDEVAVHQVLENAIDLLESHGWCRNSYTLASVLNGEDGTMHYSLLAALAAGMGARLTPDSVQTTSSNFQDGPRIRCGKTGKRASSGELFLKGLTPKRRAIYLKAVGYLQAQTEAHDMEEWNDDPDRSDVDVLRALYGAWQTALFDAGL